MEVESLQELEVIEGQYHGEEIYLKGRDAGSTLGYGRFTWKLGSVSTQIDGVIVGSFPTGRWWRVGADKSVEGEWFGVGNSGGDYTTALRNALAYAGMAAHDAQGMRVYLMRGIVGISGVITLPNRVALHGANGRGTDVIALDSFPDSANEMFCAVNGTSSMFGSRLVDLFIDMRGKGSSIGRCVWPRAWQETCGLERVGFKGYRKYAVDISDGFGGAAYLPFKDIECFGGAYGIEPQGGVNVNQISSIGGFILSVDGFTLTGASGYQSPFGIRSMNDSLILRGGHFEFVNDGVVAIGAGSVSVDTLSGSFNEVETLVTFGSGFTGSYNLCNLIPNGATNIVRHNGSGVIIPAAGQGMQAQISGPDRAQSSPLGYVLFDASTTTVGGQCAIISKSSNISGVLKTAVGRFTPQWAYGQAAGKQRSVSGGITNLDNTDPIKITHTGGTLMAEFIQVRRKLGGSTWVDYDPQRCSLQFFGDRL